MYTMCYSGPVQPAVGDAVPVAVGAQDELESASGALDPQPKPLVGAQVEGRLEIAGPDRSKPAVVFGAHDARKRADWPAILAACLRVVCRHTRTVPYLWVKEQTATR